MFLLHWIFALLKLVIKFLLITCFTNVVIAHVCCYFQTRDYTDYADYIPPSPTTANIAESLQYVKEQKAIADFSFLAKDELKSRLQARALPNERLVKAFGIENSFTTFDKVIHSKFLKRSRNVMQGMNSEQQWVSFFAAARIALQRTLFDLNRPIDSQPLASITRSFVFVAILHRFFGVDPVVVNIDDALQATDSINHLWMESKTSQPNLHEHQERLEAALKRLLPKHFPCEPECHPLNTIIPAYETMWRVVLLTYISAGFRTIDLEAIIQFRQIVASAPICFRDDWGSNSEEQAVILNFAKVSRRLPTSRRQLTPSRKAYAYTHQRGTSTAQSLISTPTEQPPTPSKPPTSKLATATPASGVPMHCSTVLPGSARTDTPRN
ncbi:hypothetical protein F5Y04DRAFT_250558 [Hypomontagnella monticulosa]|nr:hypothetical protein F5Y04DRAFT_250558 [Hypomontagnella monticulosa]